MQRVLITGAAGSLGIELVKYISSQGEQVIAIDTNEWALAELKALNIPNVVCFLVDYRNLSLSDFAGITHCIHAAAYKHLPLGEENPESFIENNVVGVMKFFNLLADLKITTLFVSTDKAVEPCSVYGYTKALGESLARSKGFSIARLSNLLGSSGSVIPVWEAAIREQRPIPVTDLNMQRYYIDIVRAACYLWDHFMKNEKLIIPDMGNPITVRELLRETLRRHNKLEDGLEINIIGIRPREKMIEKLTWDWE